MRGLDLSAAFYREVVGPIVAAAFPGLEYAAALIGSGSEVLGFDDEMSQDHDFGPRMFLLLRSDDAGLRERVHARLDQSLPATFGGFAVDFPESRLSERFGNNGRVRSHRVYPVALDVFLSTHFGPASGNPWDSIDWLTVSSQSLREFTAGAVFHDGPRELTAWRERLAWYPHDVWLYLLAAGWQRIREEEHLWQRAGSLGDELGAGILTGRLVREVMRLCFLMERVYAPYPKWIGRAFRDLDGASQLAPLLHGALFHSDWAAREDSLLHAFEVLAEQHNRLGVTPVIPSSVSPFMDRPFPVIHGSRFVHALIESIGDQGVRRLADQCLIGSVDQWSDSTNILGVERSRRRALYG